MRHEGGETEWLTIPRCRCSNPSCRKLHRMLPECLLPHKHYDTEIVSGVLDEIVSADDPDAEDNPSADTMQRWLEWFRRNIERIEGFLRLAALSLEFIKRLSDFNDSLLSGLRVRSQRWLEIITAVIYNAGNYLVPL